MKPGQFTKDVAWKLAPGRFWFLILYIKEPEEICMVVLTYFDSYIIITYPIYRNHRRCFFKKSCSYKFRNIHRKTPVLEFLFNKSETLLKRHSNTCISFEYGKIFKNTYFRKHLWMTASECNQLVSKISFSNRDCA